MKIDLRIMDRVDRDTLYCLALELYTEGRSQGYIASELGIRVATIYDWFKLFKLSENVISNNCSNAPNGSGFILSKSECEKIKKSIEDFVIEADKRDVVLTPKECYEKVLRCEFNLDLSYRTFYNYLKRWGLTKWTKNNVSRQFGNDNIEIDDSQNMGIDVKKVPILLFKSFFYASNLPEKMLKKNNYRFLLSSESGYSAYYSGLFLTQQDLDLILYLVGKSNKDFSSFNIEIKNIEKDLDMGLKTIISSFARLKNEIIIYESDYKYLKTSFIEGYENDFNTDKIRDIRLQSKLKKVFTNKKFFLSSDFLYRRFRLKNNLSKWLQWILISCPRPSIEKNELRKLAKGSCFHSKFPTNSEFGLAFKELVNAGFIKSYDGPKKNISKFYTWGVL